MKTLLLMTAMVMASLTANAYFIQNARNMSAQLDHCASTNNVYRCKVAFVPAEQPRIVTVKEAMLPPPDKKYEITM